jgi:hypothetical protein
VNFIFGYERWQPFKCERIEILLLYLRYWGVKIKIILDIGFIVVSSAMHTALFFISPSFIIDDLNFVTNPSEGLTITPISPLNRH